MNKHLIVLLLAALIIVAGAVAGLLPYFLLLHDTWTAWYGPNEHGYMVLALCIWMSVANWAHRPPRKLEPLWAGAVPLALVIGIAIMFTRTGIDTMRLTLIPLFLLTCVTMVYGTTAARRILWPVLFLYFALPQWWFVNPLLQSMTVEVANRLVRLTAIPAYIDGNTIHLPSGVFEIASGCSGLNYFLVANMLAWFFAWKNLEGIGAKAMLLVAASATALLANWVRVFVLIALGHHTEMQHYLVAVDHHAFGWVLFLFFLVPILFLGRMLQSASGAHNAVADARPVRRKALPEVSSELLPAALCAAVMLLLTRLA